MAPLYQTRNCIDCAIFKLKIKFQALIENLLLVAKSQHEKGNEFPLLLKLDPVRAGIKILKKIGADLKDLQNKMEQVYEMCEGCLQEKYGKKQKRLPQVICIGAKKCGTGAFQNFLAHHPHLHKPPGLDEVHFFDNNKEYEKGIEYYHSLMPETSGAGSALSRLSLPCKSSFSRTIF